MVPFSMEKYRPTEHNCARPDLSPYQVLARLEPGFSSYRCMHENRIIFSVNVIPNSPLASFSIEKENTIPYTIVTYENLNLWYNI